MKIMKLFMVILVLIVVVGLVVVQDMIFVSWGGVYQVS